MGKVIGIATRLKTKAPMNQHTSVQVTFENGVGNDSRGKKRNHRQVTLLSKIGWDSACEDLQENLEWTIRRANFFIDNIDLQESTGKFIQIGHCLLKVTGELNPCYRMDEQFEGLTQALTPDWRGGVTCELVAEGEVNLGDRVQLLDSI